MGTLIAHTFFDSESVLAIRACQFVSLEKWIQHSFGPNDCVVELADASKRFVRKIHGLFVYVFGIAVVVAAPGTPPGMSRIYNP